MKRADRQKLKQAQAVTDKPHSEPDNASTRDQKRNVSRDIHVRGEVEVTVPPDVRKKSDASDEKKEARERKRYRLEFAGLMAVIIYAGLTAWQAWQAKRTADAAISANTDAVIAMKLDESPWINVFDVTTSELPDGGERLAVEFKNYGKTPVFNTHAFVGMQGVRPGVVVPFPFNEHESKGSILFSPGEIYKIALNNPVTPTEVALFKSGQMWVYLRVAIWYTDYWKADHMDTFCVFFDPRSQTWASRKPDKCED